MDCEQAMWRCRKAFAIRRRCKRGRVAKSWSYFNFHLIQLHTLVHAKLSSINPSLKRGVTSERDPETTVGLMVRRDGFHFAAGEFGLVIAPAHFLRAGVDLSHGDAVIDRADKRAEIATDAIFLAHFGNRFAG